MHSITFFVTLIVILQAFANAHTSKVSILANTISSDEGQPSLVRRVVNKVKKSFKDQVQSFI